eukprot:2622312-Rhodomonas_salina.1
MNVNAHTPGRVAVNGLNGHCQRPLAQGPLGPVGGSRINLKRRPQRLGPRLLAAPRSRLSYHAALSPLPPTPPPTPTLRAVEDSQVTCRSREIQRIGSSLERA